MIPIQLATGTYGTDTSEDGINTNTITAAIAGASLGFIAIILAAIGIMVVVCVRKQRTSVTHNKVSE